MCSCSLLFHYYKSKIYIKQFDLYFPDIPTRLILTKIDKLDMCNSGDLSDIFISKHPLEKIKEAKQIYNFRDCQIHPIANYVEGTTQNITQDVLTLLACIDIMEEAVMHIKNNI